MSNEPRTDSSSPSPVAVVTGASQGLGRALTAALVERGWHVVIDARRSDRLADAVTTFGADNVTPVVGDVTDPDHRDALVAAARRQSARSASWSTTPAPWAHRPCPPRRRRPPTCSSAPSP